MICFVKGTTFCLGYNFLLHMHADDNWLLNAALWMQILLILGLGLGDNGHVGVFS